jgi:hypothetical protein
MFNDQISDVNQTLVDARIARIKTTLRALSESTLEDYQVAVYSNVNAVLNLGNHMHPLTNISPEGPAAIGDLTDNLTSLNNDAMDIAQVLLATETSAAQLFNLAAATQNQLRQAIREVFYESDVCRYIEAFLNSQNIAAGASASIDYNSGQATLPMTNETILKPTSIVSGSNSDPAGTMTNLSALLDGSVESCMVFAGAFLELIVTFGTPAILNRIQLELDDYEGLELTTLTSSPDGIIFDDVLADLGETHQVLNGTSGKLSGDVILDFPPRYVSQLRLVINDRINVGRIALRSLTFSQRSYGTSADLTSTLIKAPLGSVQFSTDQDTWGAFTTLVHQISTNGVHFSVITPGLVITVSQPFYYKVSLQRVPGAFSDTSSPIADPSQSTLYALTGSTSTDLGNGILQRTLVFSSISGPVTLRETPIPGTFQVSEGAAGLDSSNYSFSNGILSFPIEKYNISMTYQTSSLGLAALLEREGYYTPILREFCFEKA